MCCRIPPPWSGSRWSSRVDGWSSGLDTVWALSKPPCASIMNAAGADARARPGSRRWRAPNGKTKSPSSVQSTGASRRGSPSGTHISGGEHLLVVAVPLALEQLAGVVPALELQELPELRIAGLDLPSLGVPVIGRVIAAAGLDAEIDEPSKRIGGAGHALLRVLDVQVEDHASVWLFRPGEEALPVLLDQADGAVNDVHLVLAGERACIGHEALEGIALAVDLGDRLCGRVRRAELAVEGAVVVVGVDAHLVLVRPVQLAVGREVISGVAAERLGLPSVREIQEVHPVRLGKLLLGGRDGRTLAGRTVAGEHSAAQELIGPLI